MALCVVLCFLAVAGVSGVPVGDTSCEFVELAGAGVGAACCSGFVEFRVRGRVTSVLPAGSFPCGGGVSSSSGSPVAAFVVVAVQPELSASACFGVALVGVAAAFGAVVWAVRRSSR